MNLCVFLGPTLPVERAREVCDATFLPPVRQGDVYRVASLYHPRAIGIIDGYFNQVPAVWHKEILWAMERGIHVLGAASMGALRAAELEPFGMRGVGRVFEAYRDGFLAPDTDESFEDDDEVAVVHGPPETGYVPVSDSMVNIRFTLANAQASGVISAQTRVSLVRMAKEYFYPDRSYDKLLERAGAAGVSKSELERLRSWLPTGRVDQKQNDALALLRLLTQLTEHSVTATVPEQLEHTSQWVAAKTEFDNVSEAGSAVLDELRLEGKAWFEMRERAILQALAMAPSSTKAVRKGEAAAALSSFHRDPERVDALLRDENRFRSLERFADSLPDCVINQHLTRLLKHSGALERLEQRAEAKRRRLAKLGGLPGVADLTGLDELQLEEWYFEQHLGVSIPDDLENYVARLGFTEMDHFLRALIGEYHFVSRNRHDD